MAVCPLLPPEYDTAKKVDYAKRFAFGTPDREPDALALTKQYPISVAEDRRWQDMGLPKLGSRIGSQCWYLPIYDQ
jgi:hypothetical protein